MKMHCKTLLIELTSIKVVRSMITIAVKKNCDFQLG